MAGIIHSFIHSWRRKNFVDLHSSGGRKPLHIIWPQIAGWNHRTRILSQSRSIEKRHTESCWKLGTFNRFCWKLKVESWTFNNLLKVESWKLKVRSVESSQLSTSFRMPLHRNWGDGRCDRRYLNISQFQLSTDAVGSWKLKVELSPICWKLKVESMIFWKFPTSIKSPYAVAPKSMIWPFL